MHVYRYTIILSKYYKMHVEIHTCCLIHLNYLNPFPIYILSISINTIVMATSHYN